MCCLLLASARRANRPSSDGGVNPGGTGGAGGTGEDMGGGVQGDIGDIEIQGGVLGNRKGGTQYEEGFMSQSMRVHPAKLNDAK